MDLPAHLDADRCYEALLSRDARFDGQFIAAITSTRIYCRPSCPAPVHPKRRNVRVFPTAAAAQAAGFRSCKRCRPDASPGSPEWDYRGDLVGRAMRLIEQGEVDRVGVGGVADQLHLSERHLHRVLTAAVGTGPIALARAQRANLARILIETTDMAITDIAFAAGFSSVRQFNATIREVYDRTPTEMRRCRSTAPHIAPSLEGITLSMQLPFRQPLDSSWIFGFLSNHQIPGVSIGTSTDHTRTLSLPGGPGRVEVRTEHSELHAIFTLSSVSDLAPAIAAVRRLFDLDVDPTRIADHLNGEPLIAPLHTRHLGIRVPGSVDGFETAVGAVVSQQVSVAAARTFLGRLVSLAGRAEHSDPPTHLFPTPDAIVDADLASIGLTTTRTATLRTLAKAVADENVDLTGTSDRNAVRTALLSLTGIGPWTADVVMMRALRDPDILLSSDLVVRRELERLGATPNHQTSWSPWRSYVTATLWAHAGRPGAISGDPRS